MKNFIWIFILIFLNGCGYTALYKNNENHNIRIEITDMSGDKNINNLINLELKRYFNTKSENKFKLIISTKYEKKVNTKDTTGKPEEFQLSLITSLDIIKGENIYKTKFNESFKMKNSTDTFELNNYENIIKENFARSTKDKIILKLVSIQ